ncbi:uncharacterized protein [Blastocystis hominis]|uniref:Stress-associated endoplasmic reticulum protein n=1 Tax=Blastocystis hominis TaxID=12968 RepID=D8M7T8_BLAHO|nr:uncharacterized protein [Blastocystis hominis]CBK24127.2 unnamed protein product [Blastocystis hominis]|eukprot:XP_012898175.1 uncharacterized protein [Blastocystis hominis]
MISILCTWNCHLLLYNRMPESRTITKRSSKFTKKAIEHDVVEKKEDTKYPVGPWAMAFFAFVIVGSTLFQFISMWYSS